MGHDMVGLCQYEEKNFFKRLRAFVIVLYFLICVDSRGYAQDFFNLGTINIQASRQDLSIYEINKGLSVITAQDIEESTATSIPDLINTRSGIIVHNQLGNPKGYAVDLRGFGETASSHVLVLVDGRRTNQVDLSGVDWGQINLDAVERIEILRGPSTVLFGDNASAGVINIVTKRGYQSGDKALIMRAEGGSFGYHKASISLANTFRDLDYFFNFSHEDSRGYRDNNDYWANDYFGNFSKGITDQLTLNFSTGYHRDRYGMPGPLVRSEVTTLGRKATTHPDDKGWTSDVFVNMEPEMKFVVGAYDVNVSLFHSYRKRYAKSLFVSSWGRYETAHRIDSWEFQPKLEVDGAVSSQVHNHFTAGLDFFLANDQVRSGNQEEVQDKVDITKRTVALYVLERVKILERFFVDVGARGIWADYRFHQKAVVENKESRKPTQSAISLSLGYQYRKDSQLYFDYCRSFRLPATDEYYQNKWENVWGSGGGLNTALEHQTSHHFQWGIRDVSLPFMRTDVGIFFMETKNEIYFDPITFENVNYSDSIRRWGVELEGRADLFQGLLQPYIHWTWQDAFFNGGVYRGNKVPFVPRNKISAGVVASIFKAFQTTLSMQWVDQRFVISDQANVQTKLNAIITFDCKTSYQWRNANVWVSVKNIFDREYHAYGVYSLGQDDTGYYPAPGRHFLAGVNFHF